MKNLLVLAHRIPYPPNKGDKIRSYHFLKYLAADYNIYLGTFIDDPHDWQYTETLNALCADSYYVGLNPRFAKLKSLRGLLTGEALSVPYYGSHALQQWVDNTLATQSISTVLIYSSVMAQFINASHAIDTVVDFVDVDSDKWRQYAEKKTGIMRWIYQREAQYLGAYEQTIAATARMNLFVSEQEAAFFQQLAPAVADKTTHINCGVDAEHFSPERIFVSPYQADETVLVFTGAMDYWPNVDAVCWFGTAVFPLVQALYPSAKFYIVGAKASAAVLALATNPHIIITGAVDDVRPFIAHATLAVAPLRIARGIQNKVLEAMAMAKPVIATPAAMEGIPYDATLAVSVASDAELMAQQVCAVLANSALPTGASHNRDFVKTAFSWAHNVKQLSAILSASTL